MTVLPGSLLAAPPPQVSNCTAVEYRQFDFWLGDWDVFEFGDSGRPIGRTHVDAIAGNCGIHELYEQFDGLIGDSILSFDASRGLWQQTWITNRGSLMVIAGSFKDGVALLQGESHLRSGEVVLQRITWKKVGADVRESGMMSKDHGKTWVTAFDVTFHRHQ